MPKHSCICIIIEIWKKNAESGCIHSYVKYKFEVTDMIPREATWPITL